MSFLNLMRNRLKPKAVNDALTNVVQNSPPDFSSAEAGKILAVDSDGELEWKTEQVYTPPAYSTTEVNTGQKWLDGNDIYAKTYTGTTVSTRDTIDSFTGKNLVNITGNTKINYSGTDYVFSLPGYPGDQNPLRAVAFILDGSLVLDASVGVVYSITVYYTKTTTKKKTK